MKETNDILLHLSQYQLIKYLIYCPIIIYLSLLFVYTNKHGLLVEIGEQPNLGSVKIRLGKGKTTTNESIKFFSEAST